MFIGSDTQTTLNTLYIIFKIGFTILTIFYFIFSVIVTRQVKLMTEVLQTDSRYVLQFISWLHSIAAIGVFLYVALFL